MSPWVRLEQAAAFGPAPLSIRPYGLCYQHWALPQTAAQVRFVLNPDGSNSVVLTVSMFGAMP